MTLPRSLLRAATLFAALAVFPGSAVAGTPDRGLTLWYGKPAADWEHEGLPIGNGAMGAVVTGGVAADTVQFNEKTLWTGGPGSKGYDFGLPARPLAGAVADVQRLLNESKQLAPEKAAEILGHPMTAYGDYQTFGGVVLTFDGASQAPENYRRDLDIQRAIASVSYAANGVNYRREYFASYPDGVIAIRVTADRPGQITLKAAFRIPGNRSANIAAKAGRITVFGALNDNRLKYEAQLQVIAQGGTRTDAADGSVAVVHADSVVLILAAGTNYRNRYPYYRGGDPHPAVTARVARAAVKGYARLLRTHERDYRRLFDRVSLDIGQAMPDMPTDALLANYGKQTAASDRALEALYFQYGRYLLIASSRAGSLPANLQGVWNNSNTPPWNADYHVNINLQMNYWPADAANLSETVAPFLDFVDGLRAPGAVSAKRVFGARGWTLFLNTDVWGYTGLIAWPTAFWQPEAGAWLASQYYDHYRFTRDRAFLAKRAYPVMKAAARMWLDALAVDPRDGKLVVSPSYSPEHGPFSAGAAMPQQIVTGLFRETSQAAAIVKDTAFRRELERALARIDTGLRVGSWGQLQEWKEDWDDPKDDHRHVSHLYALIPGHQISPAATPGFAEAARVSLRARGDGGTGWSKAWKINFWARLNDGDHAHLMLSQQLRESTLNNLWDSHPPFQIDGNFGATAGIVEMLVQSQNDVIEILPALPHDWSEGEVRGLKARGGVTVDIAWSGGGLRRLVLRPRMGGRLTVRTPVFEHPFRLVDMASGRPVATSGQGNLRRFGARRSSVYLLESLWER
jgi:alpha-L-fucosidase 2